ncbi:TPA: alpha/beta fold hydrolase [Staphylococcus aureus]
METLELQGAKLRYHQVGQGPVLIFIPGANGTGDIFLPLAEQLKDHFTVVAVDRRDYGESELTEPLPDSASNPDSDYRVKRDAQDIAELAKSLSDEPVYILGSSSGSIVAMHVLKDYPEVVKKIAFHEPPIDAKMMSQPADTEEGRIEQYKRTMFWLEFEIRQYTHSNITLDDFTKYSDKITLLNGTDSRGSFPQDVNFYINKETGIPIVDIPGGHLGYIQKPEGFADVLLNMWG